MSSPPRGPIVASPSREIDPRPTLAAHARLFYQRGWMAGTGGNLSARAGSGLWISRSGRPKGALDPEDDFIHVEHVAGPVPDQASAETAIHQAIYRIVPLASVCYHVHTVAATVASRLGSGGWLDLPPLEVLKGLGVHEQRPQVEISVFDNHLDVAMIAREIEQRLAKHQAEVPGLLIRNHGLTAWGVSLERARDAIELFDFIFRCMVAERVGH